MHTRLSVNRFQNKTLVCQMAGELVLSDWYVSVSNAGMLVCQVAGRLVCQVLVC